MRPSLLLLSAVRLLLRRLRRGRASRRMLGRAPRSARPRRRHPSPPCRCHSCPPRPPQRLLLRRRPILHPPPRLMRHPLRARRCPPAAPSSPLRPRHGRQGRRAASHCRCLRYRRSCILCVCLEALPPSPPVQLLIVRSRPRRQQSLPLPPLPQLLRRLLRPLVRPPRGRTWLPRHLAALGSLAASRSEGVLRASAPLSPPRLPLPPPLLTHPRRRPLRLCRLPCLVADLGATLQPHDLEPLRRRLGGLRRPAARLPRRLRSLCSAKVRLRSSRRLRLRRSRSRRCLCSAAPPRPLPPLRLEAAASRAYFPGPQCRRLAPRPSPLRWRQRLQLLRGARGVDLSSKRRRSLAAASASAPWRALLRFPRHLAFLLLVGVPPPRLHPQHSPRSSLSRARSQIPRRLARQSELLQPQQQQQLSFPLLRRPSPLPRQRSPPAPPLPRRPRTTPRGGRRSSSRSRLTAQSRARSP